MRKQAIIWIVVIAALAALLFWWYAKKSKAETTFVPTFPDVQPEDSIVGKTQFINALSGLQIAN